MRISFYIFFLALVLASCGGATDRAKDAIKDGGEIVGKTVGEFGKGVTEGLEETFQMNIDLSEQMLSNGIELGKITLENSGGTDNVLVVYMMFKNDFEADVLAKIFDTAGLEMGRSSQNITAKAGEARYFEFNFDKRTNIDRDSKITME